MKEPEAMREIHAIRRKLEKKWGRMTRAQWKRELERAEKLAEEWGLPGTQQSKKAA